ncbi:hypothetical protein HDA32_005817 [Spinactinospora alkalitolerans]|uniref:Uncharacterized protein n=1 Tax=Spinactinospora alkalitolerans TaxID=687207 RepID=A0A852U516_9ACTN|nr:hypothetical protein [Spinactinospora alkalitolerans]NYE50697.1 hypothetical protein [Spinactinospora alkalitolerans]
MTDSYLLVSAGPPNGAARVRLGHSGHVPGGAQEQGPAGDVDALPPLKGRALLPALVEDVGAADEHVGSQIPEVDVDGQACGDERFPVHRAPVHRGRGDTAFAQDPRRRR